MKQHGISEKEIHSEIIVGTMVALLLLGGSMAWAEKKDGKIQLKKDEAFFFTFSPTIHAVYFGKSKCR